MKRMIDNKEFDALVKGVNDLNVKVDNIKEIPTITIDVAQFTDETTAQLTDEQYNILSNNSIVNVITPVNSKELAFLKYTNDNATNIGFSGILAYNSNNNTYDIVNITIDTTTKIATIVNKSISTGKQLYQHNIVLTAFTNNDKIMVFPIITDSDTPFTLSTLAQFLYNNGYTDNNNMVGVSGYSNLSGDIYWQGIFASTTSQVKVYSAKINQSYGNDITRITDNVKAL